MSVKLMWKGNADGGEGLATYATNESTYELWLPDFEKAHQLDSVLRDVFAEGRRVGHREMMQATSDAMNKIARAL